MRGLRRVPLLLAGGLLVSMTISACSESAPDGAEAEPDPVAGSVSPSPETDGGTGAADTTNGPQQKGVPASQQVKDQGRGAPGSPTKNGRQVDVFERLPGDASQACVTVGSQRDIRSGGIVGGAFDEARQQFGTAEPGRSKGKVRLYWIPMHTKPMSGVVVRATHVASGRTTNLRQKRIADTDQWKFYDTMVRVDRSGTWRFEVSSGKDRGCFEVEFS